MTDQKIQVLRCMSCPEDDRFTVPSTIMGRLIILTHIEYVHPEAWAFLQSVLPKELQ